MIQYIRGEKRDPTSLHPSISLLREWWWWWVVSLRWSGLLPFPPPPHWREARRKGERFFNGSGGRSVGPSIERRQRVSLSLSLSLHSNPKRRPTPPWLARCENSPPLPFPSSPLPNGIPLIFGERRRIKGELLDFLFVMKIHVQKVDPQTTNAFFAEGREEVWRPLLG